MCRLDPGSTTSVELYWMPRPLDAIMLQLALTAKLAGGAAWDCLGHASSRGCVVVPNRMDNVTVGPRGWRVSDKIRRNLHCQGRPGWVGWVWSRSCPISAGCLSLQPWRSECRSQRTTLPKSQPRRWPQGHDTVPSGSCTVLTTPPGCSPTCLDASCLVVGTCQSNTPVALLKPPQRSYCPLHLSDALVVDREGPASCGSRASQAPRAYSTSPFFVAVTARRHSAAPPEGYSLLGDLDYLQA